LGGFARDKNILLINPWIVDFKAYDFWSKPQGILYVASILDRNRYNVSFIDCMNRLHPSLNGKIRIRDDGTGKFCHEEIEKPEFYKEVPRKYKQYGISTNTFLEDLKKIPPPDLILVTSIMTYWYPGAHKAIGILKEHFPGTPVILGGIYATLCPEFARENSGADIVAANFQPKKFIEMVGKITDTQPEYFPGGILDYPPPAFHLYERLESATILTSTGCPFRCSYCASHRLSRSFLQRPAEDVVNEIIGISEEFNVSRFAFYDDALLVNAEKHIIPILEGLLQRGERFKFHTPNGLHARFITGKVAELMRKSGFEKLKLSLESSNREILEQTGGKVTTDEAAGAIEHLLEAGFDSRDIGIYLMMGMPGQTYKECDGSIEFVHNLGVQIHLSDYSPVPGTTDFEYMREIYGENIDNPLYHNNTFHHYLGWPFSAGKKKFLKDKTFRLNGELIRGD